MADFKRLADVETIETANDSDTVLVVQGGEVKRILNTHIKIVLTVDSDGNAAINVETELENVYEFLLACLENGNMPSIVVYENYVIEGEKINSICRVVALRYENDGSIALKTLDFPIYYMPDGEIVI